MKPVFALDVGGVLASKQHDGVPVEDSLASVLALDKVFDLWIVSQCGRNRALKTREWLAQWAFPIPKAKQIYIPFGESKQPHLRDIGARYFVDDRMKHITPAFKCSRLVRVFHLNNEPVPAEYKPQDHRYLWVPTWRRLMENFPGGTVPYPEFCYQPEFCAGKSHCQRDPCCID